MTRILFVSNGHGEAAIAKRIAQDVREHSALDTDHFALVGQALGGPHFADVGPQRTLPSGGLVAMGNVRAFAADVRAGFFALLGRQIAFLRAAHTRYAGVVAVGDVYALLLSKLADRPVTFVGTAKSVYVAPYGPLERRLLRSVRRVFVRDGATALFLRRHGIAAEAPGNVIVDLLSASGSVDWHGATARIALLPGSRERAYEDARRLADVARRVIERVPQATAIVSIAPGLDGRRMQAAIAGEPPVATWPDAIGALLAEATLAVGQAGTANEAAAACGVPVVALEFDGARKSQWYRKRQAQLLGDALAVVTGDPKRAAEAICGLLADGERRALMARAGRERMGQSGGSLVIARAVAALSAPAG